jgi:hypothetical protein
MSPLIPSQLGPGLDSVSLRLFYILHENPWAELLKRRIRHCQTWIYPEIVLPGLPTQCGGVCLLPCGFRTLRLRELCRRSPLETNSEEPKPQPTLWLSQGKRTTDMGFVELSSFKQLHTWYIGVIPVPAASIIIVFLQNGYCSWGIHGVTADIRHSEKAITISLRTFTLKGICLNSTESPSSISPKYLLALPFS